MSIHNSETPNLVGVNPTRGAVMPDHAPITGMFV